MPLPIHPRSILGDPVHLLAFGLGSGLSPLAPGTVGTLVAVPLFVALHFLGLAGYLAATAALFLAGCWICGESARRLGVHDYGGIVFDEIVAFLVTMLPVFFFPVPEPRWRWLWLGAGFLLFRFFDVVKPWPINLADRHVHGGLGIMLDDLLAALYAGAALAGLMLLRERLAA